MTEPKLQDFYNSFGRLSRILNFVFKKFSVPSLIVSSIFTYLWEHKDISVEMDKEVQKIWQIQ